MRGAPEGIEGMAEEMGLETVTELDLGRADRLAEPQRGDLPGVDLEDRRGGEVGRQSHGGERLVAIMADIVKALPPRVCLEVRARLPRGVLCAEIEERTPMKGHCSQRVAGQAPQARENYEPITDILEVASLVDMVSAEIRDIVYTTANAPTKGMVS